MQIAPALAEGQLALGFALFTGRLDVAGSRPYFDRAYELGGGNADIALLYALYCSRAGRAQEAMAGLTRSRARPAECAGVPRERLGRLCRPSLRRWLPPLAQALTFNPKMTYAHALRGYAFLGLNRPADAEKEFEAEPRRSSTFRASRSATPSLAGPMPRRRLSPISSRRSATAPFTSRLSVLAQWGRIDDALQRLDRARKVGDSGLIYVRTDPLLDPIRRDPRFSRFVKQLNAS